jgi:hypothetical protein
METYEQILRDFTFKDPDGNGQNDTFGLSYHVNASIANSFMAFYGAFGGVMEQYYVVDGKMYAFETMPEYRQALGTAQRSRAHAFILRNLRQCRTTWTPAWDPHCVVRWSLGVRQERRCPVIIQRTNMGHPAGRSGCVLRPPWVKIRACGMPTQGKSRGVCRGPAPAHVCTSSPPPPHPVSTNTLLTLWLVVPHP